jgi:hypothetical protein
MAKRVWNVGDRVMRYDASPYEISVDRPATIMEIKGPYAIVSWAPSMRIDRYGRRVASGPFHVTEELLRNLMKVEIREDEHREDQTRGYASGKHRAQAYPSSLSVHFEVAPSKDKGRWHGSSAPAMHVTKLAVPYISEDGAHGELCAYFDKRRWNVKSVGLVYGDPVWLENFRTHLRSIGFNKAATADVSYSEQGMQGDDYVSMDVGRAFLSALRALPLQSALRALPLQTPRRPRGRKSPRSTSSRRGKSTRR